VKFGIGLLIICLYLLSASVVPCHSIDYRACLECHKGIETLDKDHLFQCLDCHLQPKEREKIQEEHDKIVRHPAAPEHVDMFCGKCHQEEIRVLGNSLHYTMAGIMGQTRYLWGAQQNPESKHSASIHPQLASLPMSPPEPKGTTELVDDLLRNRCLQCHLGKSPPQQRGFYRGLGCSACHVFYADDGIYRGGDPSIKGKKGYPQKHTFTKPVPVQQCLHCHNGPRVGADYTGIFGHDLHHSYRTPWREGAVPEPIYLMDHHNLKPDIHFQKGLICVDCHDRGDVMGRGPLLWHQGEAVGVRCEHCHHPKQGVKEKSLPLESGIKDKSFLDRQGRLHPLPMWDQSVPAHGIQGMRRLHCTSCHSSWGFYDYGMSLIKDDRKDLTQWSSWRLQGDESVYKLFDDRGQFLKPELESGVWFLGWGFRRWENLTLGVDEHDRIVPFRPHYQFMVSFVDRNGKIILDSVIPERGDNTGPGWAYMPFRPHTIQKIGRSCENCHGQSMAAGKGFWTSISKDLSLTKANPPVFSNQRLLNESETDKLLKKTSIFRKIRSSILWKEMSE